MRNYFTFDGIDSRSFGVYISGQGTFKAPARSYDALEIPGRNGALLGIDSRLGNVELTYPAFIYSNFKENIAAFRAFLLSHKGYFKLKDSYHPDEFRLAYYPGPFEPDVTSANNAGSFDITFICKPQRYLESGEEVIELTPGQSETHTYTGNPASFVAQGGDQITSLQIPLRFYQDFHGYDYPWPAGGRVNKLPNNATNETKSLNGVQIKAENGVYTITGTPTAEGGILFNLANSVDLSPSTNKIAFLNNVANANISVYFYRSGTPVHYWSMNSENRVVSGWTDSGNEVVNQIRIWFNASAGSNLDITVSPMLIATSETNPTSFSPYSNICPISGGTGLNVYVSPTQDQQDAATYSVDWTAQAGTVYGGTLDVVTGLLTVDRASVNVSSSWNWTKSGSYPGGFYAAIENAGTGQKKNTPFMCSHAKTATAISQYVKGTCFCDASINIRIMDGSDTVQDWKDYINAQSTAGTPIQICYELATPITYQLTPVQIAALLAGETFVWSSNNEEVTVEVTSAIPTIIENPTLFDALPFLRVYGTGILGIGSHTITITAADVYTDIDCEMMDCFKGSANKNQYVQFSGNDFPTLEPGVNGFSFSGITKVEVKPRWWSV